jgi:hypothetical protein
MHVELKLCNNLFDCEALNNFLGNLPRAGEPVAGVPAPNDGDENGIAQQSAHLDSPGRA